MSRRLSKKSRATKLATNVAFSAANLPKLETSVLDALFARSRARKRSLRGSLMVGTVLSVGILAASLVNTSPALALCGAPVGGTITCSGTDAFINVTDPPVSTVNLVGDTVGPAPVNNGVTLTGGANNQTLTVSADAASAIGATAGTAVGGDGELVYSKFTGAAVVITNAATIGSSASPVGQVGIFGFINDGGQTAADSISITNTAAKPIYTSSTTTAIAAALFSNPTTATPEADTVSISNSGQIGGSATNVVGGDGIFAHIALTGTGVGTTNINNTASVFSKNDSVYGNTHVAPFFYNGTGKAYTNMTNSGALTTTAGAADGAFTGIAYAGEFGKSSVAIASVTLTNTATGTITATGVGGVFGNSTAKANNTGAPVLPATVTTGGAATATVSISNKAAVTTKGGGTAIYGTSIAYANATAPAATAALGGTAKATTTVYNNNALTTTNGVTGVATANAEGTAGTLVTKDVGTGGSATAMVTITNVSAGAIKMNGTSGIYGVSKANASGYGYVGVGGVASATTSITNAAAISGGNGMGFAIYGGATEMANGRGNILLGSGTGGVAPAIVNLANSGPIGTAAAPFAGLGFGGESVADANGTGFVAKGGTATASTTLSNSAGGTIYSTGTSILGTSRAYASGVGSNLAHGAGTGGTASATVSITNAGLLSSTGGDGINGFSLAHAYGIGYTGKGGTATSLTTISNTGPIQKVDLNGIYGGAVSDTSTLGLLAGSTGTGGTSNATVLISNSNSIYNKNDSSIFGNSSAISIGLAYTAKGGTATASTSISNSGYLTSVGATKGGNGIDGVSAADASGVGGLGAKASGTGGTASATVTITNVASGANGGQIASGGAGSGIVGLSSALADGAGYTAKGGTATALTTISNPALVTSTNDNGIFGTAEASADALSVSGNIKGVGTGGTATATVSITNTGNIYANTLGADGIGGLSLATATGTGFHAYGGTAKATTVISNSGSITGDAGILGIAIALAGGYGSAAIEPGKGVGGTAVAALTITNTLPGTISTQTIGGDGIDGITVAVADGNGHQAVGGTAVSTMSINNAQNIYSAGNGILGIAIASASGNGAYGILGSGKGGTATATVSITNSGSLIHSYGGGGIIGFSDAVADGYGQGGIGGTATAMTIINNAANIISYGPAITTIALAQANGYKTGGTATATTTFSNSMLLKTYGVFAPGILAVTYASADPPSPTSTGGTATATTSVSNSGTILTFGIVGSPGIFAGSIATAAAHSGGTAVATTTAVNSGGITTIGILSPGVSAFSIAASSGTASATTTVVNTATGAIATVGPLSSGVFATSLAIDGGTATATTSVSNAGSIITGGYFSDGVLATSFALGAGFSPNATAITSVANAATGTIKTYGGYSDGIFALSTTAIDATASTTVVNNGNITTFGNGSVGIDAVSLVLAGLSQPGTATTTVINTGNTTTYGNYAAGVIASATALSAASTATANVSVSNSGSIYTTGSHSRGVAAYATAVGPRNSVATIAISNTNLIETTGHHSPAIYALVTGVGTSTTGDSITIANSATGTIAAFGGFHQFGYHAIEAYGAPTTISNAGKIYGNVQLGAFNNVFNNTATGLWAMHGNSNFGGKGSVVNNAGTVSSVLRGTYQSSKDPGTLHQTFSVVTLSGLEMFNNSGTVTMVDGSPHDRIVITGPTSLTGNKVYFNGTGASTLMVDASLGGPPRGGFGGFGGFGSLNASSADVLQVGSTGSKGYVTGVTNVVVNDVSPNLPGAYNPVGIPVAESNGAANIVLTSHTVAGVTISGPANSASNFEMLQGPIQKGFFSYGLFYLPKNEAGPCQAGFNCWFLASTPSRAALEFTQLGTAANDIWSDAAGMWLDRNADLRDYFFMAGSNPNARGGGADLAVKAPIAPPPPAGVGPGAWVRAYGDWIDNKQNASFSAFGTTLTSSVQYNQTIAGAQMGYDWAFMRTGFSAVLVGLMGGADGSTVNFGSGNKVTFQGGNAGAYATFLNHGFFADGLFLANWMSMDYTAGGTLFGGGVPNTGVNANVQQYGGRIDTGYRFQFNPWFFEPQLTAEVVHTNFGNLPFPTVGTTVQVDDDTSVRGRLGGRLGTTFVTGGWRVEPSVTGGVWETLSGNNGAVLTSNGFALDLTDPSNNKTQGEVGGMLDFYQLGTNWSAFVKGDYRFASDYTSGSVKGGVRYQW